MAMELPRSIESTRPVCVRYRNATRANVCVVWLDFCGRPVPYKVLPPRSHVDIDTYVTHPWVFEDSRTKEQYVINNKPIFYPPTNCPRHYRTHWNITVNVRSLKYSALLTVARLIRVPDQCDHLALPLPLVDELKKLVTLIHEAPVEPFR